MPLIKVGDGYTTPDYISSQLAYDTLSGTDQGGDIIVECLGYCGVFTPTGTAVNLFHFKPAAGLVYDGTNESLLPTMERCAFSQSSRIIIDDILIFTANQYVTAFSLSSDAVTSNRCVFDNRTAGVNAIVINGIYPNTNINNFVARGGADAINAGYLRGTNFNKGEVYGAVGFGVNGSAGAGNLILTDVFAFGNGTDFDTSNMTLNNCASQDLTGTAGLTGYTSVELVNLAELDLRIKATSPLATAGTIDFIGSFLEQSLGITASADILLSNLTLSGLTQQGDTISGTSSYILKDLTLVGSALQGSSISGTSSYTLQNTNLSGSSILGNSVNGSSSYILENLSLTSEAVLGSSVIGISNYSLESFSLYGISILGNFLVGNSSATLDDLLLAGVSTLGVNISGVGTLNLDNLTLQGLISIGEGSTGTMSVTLDKLILQGIVDAFITKILENDISLVGIFNSDVAFNLKMTLGDYNIDTVITFKDIVESISLDNNINIEGTL